MKVGGCSSILHPEYQVDISEQGGPLLAVPVVRVEIALMSKVHFARMDAAQCMYAHPVRTVSSGCCRGCGSLYALFQSPSSRGPKNMSVRSQDAWS